MCFGIAKVILVGLEVGFYELRQYEGHLPSSAALYCVLSSGIVNRLFHHGRHH
jgi:hypothetical protein